MNLMEKLNFNFKENKLFYLLVLTFFFVGILLGAYTIKYMDGVDAKDLSDYFTGFLQTISTKEVATKDLMLNVLTKNIFFILLTFGAPIILLIDLIKGFTLGYTFSFLLTTFEGKGIWVALVTTIPQNLLYIPFFVGISIISLDMSLLKMKEKFFNGSRMNKAMLKRNIVKFGIFLIIFVVGVIIESYVSPGLIRLVVTKAYKLT